MGQWRSENQNQRFVNQGKGFQTGNLHDGSDSEHSVGEQKANADEQRQAQCIASPRRQTYFRLQSHYKVAVCRTVVGVFLVQKTVPQTILIALQKQNGTPIFSFLFF